MSKELIQVKFLFISRFGTDATSAARNFSKWNTHLLLHHRPTCYICSKRMETVSLRPTLTKVLVELGQLLMLQTWMHVSRLAWTSPLALLWNTAKGLNAGCTILTSLHLWPRILESQSTGDIHAQVRKASKLNFSKHLDKNLETKILINFIFIFNLQQSQQYLPTITVSVYKILLLYRHPSSFLS